VSRARSFLFLQGGSSPFFARLADHLAADRHAVFRINFNGGDRAYWGRRPAESFRGSLEELPAYYEEKFSSWDVSDVVVYNDRRPVHMHAIALAEKRNLRTHVFEEGYFRPFYVTLERGGVTGNSRLPKVSDWYRAVGQSLPDCQQAEPFAHGLRARALHDIAYEVANLVNPFLYARYRSHVPYNRWLGYAAHIRRYARFPVSTSRDRALVEGLLRDRTRFYLLPLQLDSDAQIRYYSPFENMSQVIACVMGSFALNAPFDTCLVIKNHPLDPGFVNYRRQISRLARELGVHGRVRYMETEDASVLLQHALGVITVNSTVGTSSLMRGCPTIVLGQAVYNLPGLTFQGGLDAFWHSTPAPDQHLFRLYKNTVLHTTQVHGGFYTREGIELAVANSMPFLLRERSPLEELL